MAWMSAAAQFRLIESGDASAAELRDDGVRRCEALDPSLGFLVSSLAERSAPGVPMLLKDAGQEMAGTPHFAGVAALREVGHVSTATTELAARFESMGFSIIGKSACPPLSSGVTTEPPGFAPTRNPWDRARSPGGSSGGSAAAVASGVVPVAHGSDATGSLRFPAALCGLVTLTPTAGLVAGVAPCGQPRSDAWRDFVLARDVEDLVLVYEHLVGPVPDAAVSALRVGILDHDPELGMDVHASCRHGVHRAAELLEQLGHVVEPAWPDALDRLWQQTFASFSVVSDATRRPILAWLAERLGRAARAGDVSDDVFEAAARDGSRTDEQRRQAQRTIDEAVAPIRGWWRDFEILVTPSTFRPAWPLGAEPGVAESGSLAAPFSLTGQPTMSLPLHQSDDGLPVGVQLVGRSGDDARLLRLARELQSTSEWLARRPPIFAPG